jgi:hypothetical protein
MPFDKQPPGFSFDALRLLDVAMTRAWLERVAIGASLSRADASLCADLWEKVERLDKLQLGRRSVGAPKSRQPENTMAAHRYKVGQRVIFHSPRSSVGPSLFTVLRLLPTEGQGITYRIKSTEGSVERVAKESELTSLHEEAT